MCDVCESLEDSYESSLGCEKGHYLCYGCTEDLPIDELIDIIIERDIFVKPLTKESLEKELEKYDRRWGGEYEMVEHLVRNYLDQIPSELCPVCNFSRVTDKDIDNYIYVKYNLNKGDIEKEIRNRFKDREEFNDYLYKRK